MSTPAGPTDDGEASAPLTSRSVESEVSDAVHPFDEVDQYGTFTGGPDRPIVYDKSYGNKRPFMAFSELDEMIFIELRRYMKYCLMATLIGIVIPVMPLVLILLSPVLYFRWNEHVRDVVFGIVMCFAVAVVFFAVPIVVWSIKGWDLIAGHWKERDALSQVEVISVFAGYFFTLYFLAYIAVVSHDVTSMFKVQTTKRRAFVQQNNPLAEEYLKKLEDLPGWASQKPDNYDQEDGVAGSASPREHFHGSGGVAAAHYRQAHKRATARALFSTSGRRFLTREDREKHRSYGHGLEHVIEKAEREALSQKLASNFQHWLDHAQRQQSKHHDLYDYEDDLTHWSQTLTMHASKWLVLFALVRALIPRFWLYFMFGEAFLPVHDPGMCAVIVHSFLMSWLVWSLWFVLFNNVRSSYKHEMIQMMLITALVSKKHTTGYKKHILHKYGITVSKEIPHMSLSKSEVIKSWWLLREYALVNMMEERVPLEIVLVIASGYIAVVLMYSLIDFFLRTGGGVGAFTIMSLFDTLVISNIAIQALSSCVTINEVQAEHTTELVKCRHTKLFLHAGGVSMKDEDAFVIRLLNHLAQRVMYHDHRQRILGLEIDSNTLATIYIETAIAIGSNLAIMYRYLK